MMENAYALAGRPEGPAAEGQNPLTAFMPLIMIFVIFYFLLIRPQQKKQKEHRQMLSKLKKGDRVVTSSGIHGEVIGIKDKEDVVVLRIAENVKVEFSRSTISTIVNR